MPLFCERRRIKLIQGSGKLGAILTQPVQLAMNFGLFSDNRHHTYFLSFLPHPIRSYIALDSHPTPATCV